MNKIYLSAFLGNTFFSTQEYTVGRTVVPIGTKFTLIAREGGRFLYQYHYLMPVGVNY